MKKMKPNFIYKFLLIAIFFSIVKVLNAQPIHRIESLSITPPNPLISNEVSVICHAAFEGSKARLDSSKKIINNNKVNILGYYFFTAQAFPSSTIDTVKIGILKEGDYKLTYYVKSYNVYDSGFVEFSVGNLGLKEKGEFMSYSIFPNPCNKEINLYLKDPKKYEIRFINSIGLLVDKLIVEGNLNYVIPVTVPAGLYFLEIINSEGMKFGKRIQFNKG